MSDKSKEEKLAAARKLLKEFQQKNPPRISNSPDNLCTNSVTNVDNTQAPNLPTFNGNTVTGLSEEQIADNNQNIEQNPIQIEYHYGTNYIVNQLSHNDSNAIQNPFENIFQKSQDENFYENLPKEVSSNTALPQNIIDTEVNSNNEPNINVNENLQGTLCDIDTPGEVSTATENILNVNEILSTDTGIDNQSETVNERNEDRLLKLLNQEQTKYNNLETEHQKLILELEGLKTQLNESHNKARTDEDEKNISSLNEKVQLHMNTIKVLVGEKTELNAQINKYESLLLNHNAECEELQGRLRAVRHKAADSEKELTQCKKICQQLEGESKMMKEQNDKLKSDYTVSIKEAEELKEEVSELKEKIKILASDCKRLETELAGKSNELSLSHLRIQQILSGNNTGMDNSLQSLMDDKTSLETKVTSLEESLEKSKNETVQITQQYKQYCQQLNSQMQNLVTTLQEKTIEIEKYSSREKDLMNHMAELEKQLQIAPKVKSTTSINENSNDELIELKEKYSTMEKKYEDLHLQLIEKCSELQSMTEQFNEGKNKIIELEESLENLQVDTVDTAKLNAAIESDKIAAARSMAQNAELKKQVEELQKSFIQMSDYKLEITEKLNCEQHLGRELNSQVIKLENEVQKLRSVLEAKNEEMIRLQNENANLSKEVIQQAQLSDRLRHYEAKDNVTDIVQNELQQARDQIAMLLQKNTELEKMLSNDSDKHEEMTITLDESNDTIKTIPDIATAESKTVDCKDTVPVIATQEALEKLQEKFTKTMADIAELTEEKHRLEHLVLQLQSETETVGEYIALYQNQRSLLKQREIEKDNQLMKLAHDQEDMKNKLLRLNQLIMQLLKEKHNTNEIQNQDIIAHHDQNSKEILDINSETKLEDSSDFVKESVDAQLVNYLPSSDICQSTDIAKKITDLLSELKSSDLIHPINGEDVENFAHHCHCCSGRLLTV